MRESISGCTCRCVWERCVLIPPSLIFGTFSVQSHNTKSGFCCRYFGNVTVCNGIYPLWRCDEMLLLYQFEPNFPLNCSDLKGSVVLDVPKMKILNIQKRSQLQSQYTVRYNKNWNSQSYRANQALSNATSINLIECLMLSLLYVEVYVGTAIPGGIEDDVLRLPSNSDFSSSHKLNAPLTDFRYCWFVVKLSYWATNQASIHVFERLGAKVIKLQSTVETFSRQLLGSYGVSYLDLVLCELNELSRYGTQ